MNLDSKKSGSSSSRDPLQCTKSVEWAYSRDGTDGGLTKYQVYEVKWDIPNFRMKLNGLKDGVRLWETVVLGEQKVTLALLRETSHLVDSVARDQWPVVSGPVYYDDWLSLDLKNVSEEILWLHSVEVSFGLLKLQCKNMPVDLHTNEGVQGLDRIIEVDRAKSNFSKNTPLSMVWKIKVECGGCKPMSGHLQEDRAVLPHQFYQLYQQDLLTDYTLVCAGEKLKVHKAILAARSEYWKGLFTSGMAETSKDSTEVLAVNLPTLHLFLEFIYTGKISEKLEPGQVELLLEAADFYAVHSLKEQCEEGLIASLGSSNLIDRLILADTFSASNLRRVAKQMLVQNLDWLVHMEGWKKKLQERVALALEVMEEMAHTRAREVGHVRKTPETLANSRNLDQEEEYQEGVGVEVLNEGVPVAQMV